MDDHFPSQQVTDYGKKKDQMEKKHTKTQLRPYQGSDQQRQEGDQGQQ